MNCAFLQTLRSKVLLLLVGVVLFVAPLSVLAQFNPEINYQGKLTDNTGMAVPDGTYNMNFWLVPTSGGATSTAVWSEVRTGGNQVQVTNGLFSVMLGEVSTLTGVDFDQELYLAVEIGGTGSPSWDGELLPRKILGAVPVAFYAQTSGTADTAADAELLGGVASSSFLRSDAADEMTASSTSPILSIIQNGVGKVLALFSGVTEVFTVLSNGNVGVGTTTPSSTFAVDGNTTLDGNLTITGGLYDNNNATGSVGDILVSTGSGINWNATSSLGLGNGTFLGLSDTPASYTANRVFFTNGAGNAITASDNLLFNGTNLAVGTTTLSSRLTVDGDIAFWGIQTTGEPVFAGEVWEDRNTESGVGSEVMYDADIGPSGEMIAVAGSGIVVTSTDGGDTWTDRTTAAGAGSNSLFASAIGPSGEMIVGGTTGYLRTSTDGGASWTNRTSAAGSGSTAIRGVAIGPSGEMLAVGSSGYVRTSTDGGASWTNRNTAASAGSNTLYVAAIGPSGEMIIGGSSGYLRISTDGGDNWTNRATEAGTSGFSLNEADFGPGGEIILVGSNGYVRTSTDGGANWTDRNAAAGAGSTTLEDAAFGPDGEMIVVGSDGYVRVSTDGGANWTDRKTEAGTGTTSLRGTDIGPDGEMIVIGGLGFIITSFDGVLDVDETIPYLASNNGNVGVGTTTPSARLDVWGDFKVGTSSIPLLYANTATQLLGIGTSTGASKFTVQGSAGADIVTIASSAGSSLMTVTEAGNVGVGTTTPNSLLSVAGNTYIGGDISIAGALRDGLNASGTEGMILQTTGTSTRWVATSTLGVGNGTFLGLSDTISSFTANRVLYTSGSAVVDSANFVFNGTNLGIGTSTPNNLIQVYDLIQFNNSDQNTQLGFQAGKNLVSNAQYNTFIGYQAGFASSTGSTNDAFFNTAIGAHTLYSNTAGSDNIAIGYASLYSNTAGNFNIANGSNALTANTTGSNNIALGGYSLSSNTNGSNNTALGSIALSFNTNGSGNTALGYLAGRHLTDGTSAASTTDNSIFIGYNTKALTADDQNAIVIGYNANGLGSNTVVLGNDSIVTTALKGNVGIGTTSPTAKLDVYGSLVVGTSSTPLMYANTAARQVAFGTSAIVTDLDGEEAMVALSGSADGRNPLLILNEESENQGASGRIMFTRTSNGADRSMGIIDFMNSGRINAATDVGDDVAGSLQFSTDAPGAGTGIVERMRITSSGNVGIGTTTPGSKLTVAGDFYLTGALRDGLNASGTSGMVLQTTGTSTRWVATSTLGFTSGATTFLGLTDTPGSYTANRIMFTNSGATALTDSANFVFDGTNLGIGTSTPSSRLQIDAGSVSTTTPLIRFSGYDAVSEANLTNLYIGLGQDGAGGYSNMLFNVEDFNVGGAGFEFRVDNLVHFKIENNAIQFPTLGQGLLSNSDIGVVSVVSTSSLGLGNGTFLGLTDTPSSFAANRIMFTNSGATALTDSATFVFDGTNLGIGTSTPNNRIQVLDLIQFNDAEFRTQLGYQAGQNLIAGAVQNTFVGYQAGFSSSTGSTANIDYNTGVGYRTLYSNTSGSSNTAYGHQSLYSNTTGSFNTANGGSSLYSNTSGALNTSSGYQALNFNTTGSNNAAGGYQSLFSNTTGNSNTANGAGALYSNINGSYNTANGYQALYSNTTGAYNLALGYQAGRYLTDGSSAASTTDNSIFIGYNTKALTSNDQNTIVIGQEANGLGSNTVVLGNDSIVTTALKGNVGIGTTTPSSLLTVAGDFYLTGALRDGLNASGTSGMVLQTTGTSTRWVATSTLGFASSLFTDGGATTYLTAVGDNLAIGTTTATSRLTVDGSMNVTGNVDIPSTNAAGTAGVLSVLGNRYIHGYTLDNTYGVNQFMGYLSGNFTLGSSTNQFAGIDNLGIGRSTLSSLTQGSYNVAIGQTAMSNNTTGGSNTAVGWAALQANTTGIGNSVVGRSALAGNTTGIYNSALGYSALGQNTTGERNVAIGAFALLNNTTGILNVAVGQGALSANVNGEGNVAVGQEALQFATSSYNTALGMFAGNTITTGGSNTIIGSNSGDGITTGENNTILGANVTGLSSTLSNNIIIADGAGNRRINVDSSGNVGIGTTTPTSRLSVVGDAYITGALRDGLNASGTNGMVLQTTGTSTRWVATSTLGFATSLFTDGGAVTYLTDTADNFALGTTTAGSKLTVEGDVRVYGGINFGAETIISYVNSNIMMGGFALPGAVNNDVYSNVAIGNIAGNGLGLGWSNVFLGNGAGTSIATGSRSVIIGNEAAGGDFGTVEGGEMVLIGDRAGYSLESGSSFSTFVGFRAGENVTTGGGNTLLGYRAGDNITDGYGNIVIGYDLEAQSASQFQTLNIGNLLFGTGVDGTATTLSSGNIGIGTSTPGSKLTVAGDFYLTGALRDGLNASGTSGMVLQSTGTSTQWVATSTLGFSGGGATTFLALTDTISSFTANRILYTSGSAVVDSADLTYDGTDLGLGAGDGIAFGGDRVLFASTTANNYVFGRLAGDSFTSGSGNILLGTESGRNITGGFSNVLIGGTFNGSGITTGSENTFIGSRVGSNVTTAYGNTFMGADAAFETVSGDINTFFGSYAGSRLATTSESVLIGSAAGQGPAAYEAYRLTILGAYAGESLATGADNNILLGYQAADNLTTGANNLVIGYDVDIASTTGSNQLNIGNIIFGTGIDGTGTTLSSGNIGIGTTTPGSKLTVVGSTQFGGASNRANISAGGVLTFSGTGGYSVASNAYAFTAAAAPLAGIYFNASNLGLDFMDTTGTAANRIGIDGTDSYFNSGDVGIGTTTPTSKLSVVGDFYLTGALRDGANASGTQGMVLQSTGTSTRWVATSTLGISGGSSLFTDGGAETYLTDTADNLAIGTTTAGSKLTIDGDLRVTGGINFGAETIIRYTSGNLLFGGFALGNNVDGYRTVAIGDLAGNSFNTGFANVFIGNDAAVNLATSSGSVVIGDLAAGGNAGAMDGGDMVIVGSRAGYNLESGGNNGVMIGAFAGENVTTGGGNIMLGYRAGNNITDGYGNIAIGYDIEAQSASQFQTLNIGNLLFGTGLDGSGTTLSSGNIGIGTTTPESRLAIERLGFADAGVAGLSQYIRSTNSTLDATQYGSQLYMYASNTATTTLIGSITRVADNTTFGNTTRGLEIQADNGNNTLGENTGLAAFARTFGVRGTTVGNAGGVFEPAGVFGETEGTTQGNAIRGYSSSITSAALLKLFQDTSTFTGTGLLMNFGNAGGSFSSTTASRFIDLQNAGTSLFTVGARGMTTIGDGTTSNNAGLQIGYGGICVDNDGSCVASTTGRITAVSYTTANSDLAETYFSSDDLQTGEVVSLKGELSIERADEDNKNMVLGVVTTKPGLLLGSDDSSLTEGEDVYGVALSGRVPVRLSNENGDIKAGDKLMLSSVPGVAMKASSTGMVVGIALEDFVDTRAYSDTYINQFGDDLVDPIYVPVNSSNDPRINDGCYYGAGSASGEAECVPLVGTTTDAQVLEAEALAAAEAQAEALEALKYVQSERVTLDNGDQVRVGQIVMFVSLEERYLDEDGIAMVAALLAAAPDTEGEESETETIWSRLVTLASNFVDGVLSVFTLKADRVEVQDEICVDGVCLNADDLRQLLDANSAPEEVTDQEPEETPVENPEPETPVEEPEEVVEETTPEEEVPETPTEPVVEEVPEEVVPEEEVGEEEEAPLVEPESEVEEEPEVVEEPEEVNEPESTPETPVEETP